jgi:hypothetical protein
LNKFGDRLDEYRCWDIARLAAARDAKIRHIRCEEVDLLAMTRALDERRALRPDQAARDGVSDATVRRQVETARRLESLPALADAALAGELSAEQLAPAVELADEDTDGEWAARARSASPMALQRMAREQRTMSREESVRRRERRSLRKWRDDNGFLCGRFEVPLEHGGAEVEAFFDQVAERMRPAKGERWASLEHRYADTLIGLCRADASAEAHEATAAARPTLVIDVPLTGPATLAGVALPSEWVDALRAEAKLALRAVGDHGEVLAEARARKFVSDKRRSAVIRRDGHCRWPGCRRRLGLQVHHLVPSSRGGTDEVANLAAVCPSHHALLVPHGEYVLAGNPNQPDGLELRRISADERRRQRQRSPSAA